MSADNWSKCPKCGSKVDEVGNRITDILDTRTFREDYEIGMTLDGKFYVHYRGSCQSKGCKFKFQYNYSKKVMEKA